MGRFFVSLVAEVSREAGTYMALITLTGDGLGDDENLAIAEQLFEQAGSVLGQKLLQVKQDDFEAKGLKAAVADMTAAWQMASRERLRVVEALRKDQGIVGTYAIDFERARDEIGRRLDCLRRAGGV